MNKFEKFAVAMSVLLYEMRAEDLNNSMLFDDDQEQIPVDFIDKALDSDIYAEQMKSLLRLSVLKDVTANPDDYDMNGDDYVYSGKIYEHAYLVDEYIKDQYMKDNPVMKLRMVCDTCGSDNVQCKAWVRPNQNNQFVDLMTEDINDNYCDDCQENVGTSNVEINVRHRVEGFQVVDTYIPNTFHPHMANNKSLYSLDQANAMMDDDNNGDEQWQLLAIYTDIIEGAVKMFEGDPRA